jgi:hypothetical protein
MAFSEERNLEIIAEHYRQNPDKAIAQVNFLSHFPWVGHIKGAKFPDCQCLRCKGLNLINRLKNENSPCFSEIALNITEPTLKP